MRAGSHRQAGPDLRAVLVAPGSTLDLTAAFDTVDHDLLMLHLERQFGVVLYSSGSDHIFQTGLSESCLAPVLRF